MDWNDLMNWGAASDYIKGMSMTADEEKETQEILETVEIIKVIYKKDQ